MDNNGGEHGKMEIRFDESKDIQGRKGMEPTGHGRQTQDD
jgi:hypothetical protein